MLFKAVVFSLVNIGVGLERSKKDGFRDSLNRAYSRLDILIFNEINQ